MVDQVYTLVFDGRAGDQTDVAVQKAIQAAGGEVIACGTFLASNPAQRDIEFRVPADQAETLIAVLRRFGVHPHARVH